MAKIGLIDVDYSGYPNIPLMKLSQWHKNQGDSVQWYDHFSGRFDVVYVSKVFSFSADFQEFINADKVVRGGSGYAISLKDGRECYNSLIDRPLPYEIEHTYPDYSIYPNCDDTAYGFLSRGCPRGCDFCHVAKKEGKMSKKVSNLDEFWRGQRNIVLCDPNILACRDWKDLLQQLIDSKALVDFNQGLDARLMTEEKARMLNRVKIKEIHFAWDKFNDKESVLKGLRTYSEFATKRPHQHNAIVYTIVNFDTTIEQDLERIYTLRELGYWAYVMIYDKEHCPLIYKKLQRWVNNRIIFAKCERFEQFLG